MPTATRVPVAPPAALQGWLEKAFGLSYHKTDAAAHAQTALGKLIENNHAHGTPFPTSQKEATRMISTMDDLVVRGAGGTFAEVQRAAVDVVKGTAKLPAPRVAEKAGAWKAVTGFVGGAKDKVAGLAGDMKSGSIEMLETGFEKASHGVGATAGAATKFALGTAVLVTAAVALPAIAKSLSGSPMRRPQELGDEPMAFSGVDNVAVGNVAVTPIGQQQARSGSWVSQVPALQETGMVTDPSLIQR